MHGHIEPGLVSIITPTFNRASLIARSVRSALAQTYARLEVVVVDDGSTDGTPQVLARLGDPRVRVLRHSTNRGSMAAKNTALDHLRGEYGLVLDSDDELVPDAIECMVGTLEALGPDWGMVFADCLDPATGEVTGHAFPESREATYEDALCGNFRGEFVGLWRTKLLDGLRFDEQAPFGENLVWYQIYRRARVYYLKAPLRRYHRDAPDALTAVRFEDVPRHRRMAYGQRRYIQEFGGDMARFSRAALGHQYQVLALYEAIAGNRASSLRAVLAALRHAPTPGHVALLAMPFVPRPLLRRLLERREALRRLV